MRFFFTNESNIEHEIYRDIYDSMMTHLDEAPEW